VVRPTIPADVEAAVSKALVKAPADRFATAEQFAEVLNQALLRISAPTFGRERRSSKRLLGTLAAGVLAALGLILWQPWAGEEVAVEGGSRAWTILAAVEGSAPEDIRDLVGSLLAGDIDASGMLQTVPEDEILLGLARAMKPDTTRLTHSVARELAERGGIGTVFAPELDQVGGTYALRVRLLDVAGDSVLATERSTAAEDDGLIPASREVVEGLMPVISARQGSEVGKPWEIYWPAVTFSLEALRKAREAGRANRDGRYHEAVALCREALEIDPGFASAWNVMRSAYGNAGFGDSARYALREALKHPDRMPETQRLRLEAMLARDWVTQLQIWERWYRETGDGHMYAYCLADGFGRYEEAVVAYERTDEHSPFGLNPLRLSNWVGYLLALGRVAEAESLAVGLEGTAREVPFKARIAVRKGDWAEAERLALEVARDPAINIRWRSDAIWNLASARTARGRIREAVTALHEMIEMNQESGRLGYHRRAQVHLLTLTKAAALDPEPWGLEALQNDSTERARVLSGLWAAALGNTALAQSYLNGLPAAELGELDTPSVQGSFVAALFASLSVLREDWEQVVRILEPVTGDRSPRGISSTKLPNWIRAEAEEELGHQEQAARLYAQIAEGYRFGDYEVNGFGITYSFAHRKAALLYSQLDDYDRAEEHWLAFLDAFTNPDPEYEWMVDEARSELERLARGR
jgi:tetratricopeptide (TPR) repeat protein